MNKKNTSFEGQNHNLESKLTPRRQKELDFVKESQTLEPNKPLRYVKEKEIILMKYIPGIETVLEKLDKKEKGELYYNFFQNYNKQDMRKKQ